MVAEVTPNLFDLTGREGTHVTYSTTSFTGQPQLNYRDAHYGALTFKGDEIRNQDTEVGQLVSVTLKPSVDQGGVLFTLLLPSFTIHSRPGTVSFDTEGILTTQHVAVDNPMLKGPNETYRFMLLHGTAEAVEP